MSEQGQKKCQNNIKTRSEQCQNNIGTSTGCLSNFLATKNTLLLEQSFYDNIPSGA
jgi:hypothetical protein